MNNIEVSIVIPIYNVEKYVRKTIESVQHQVFDAYEIILVDDGSKDNSSKICDEYAANDNRIRVIHQPNGGVMSARFAGVDAAKGQYIAFLDGDDRMPPSAISVMFTAIDGEHADMVKGAVVDITENGEPLSKVVMPGHEGIIEDNEMYRLWLTQHMGGMNIRMYRRDVLIQEPRIYIDPGIKNNEDYIFSLFIASKINKVVFVQDLVTQVVQHNDSVSHRAYDESYWCYFLSWYTDNYNKYDVHFRDYMFFKMRIIFCNLLLENADVNYKTNVFKDVRECKYSKFYGWKFNFAIFAVKHPYPCLLEIFRFRPRKILRNIIRKVK